MSGWTKRQRPPAIRTIITTVYTSQIIQTRTDKTWQWLSVSITKEGRIQSGIEQNHYHSLEKSHILSLFGSVYNVIWWSIQQWCIPQIYV